MRIALNGSQGIVVGPGTRDRPGAMCLSLAADMHGMDATLMENPGGRPRHVAACALPIREPTDLDPLIDWARSRATQSLFSSPASKAAMQLKQMIRQNSFRLSETGPIGGKAAES